MNNHELIKEFELKKIKSRRIEGILEDEIFMFLRQYPSLNNHDFEIDFSNNGQYITLHDSTIPRGGHVPLKILFKLCNEFDLKLDSIKHEVTARYKGNNAHNVEYIHDTYYIIVFEVKCYHEMFGEAYCNDKGSILNKGDEE